MTGTDPAALAVFIGSQRTEHHIPHRLACQVLGVSESWFYKWRDKPTTGREIRRGQLTDTIRQIFEDSGTRPTAPRRSGASWSAGLAGLGEHCRRTPVSGPGKIFVKPGCASVRR